jgi:DNA polymerase-3 subunit epsilon
VTVNWTTSSWLTLDTETTGVDVDTDRIVTASLLHIHPDGLVEWGGEWLADPGAEIPAEAEAVHGVSTADARRDGLPAAQVVAEIEEALDRRWNRDTPLVVANAPFDLSLLNAELMRHHRRPITFSGGVLDPITCDRKLDKYRRGGHTLGALCKTYRVDPGRAHSSASDAFAAAAVMRAMVRKFPQLAAMSIGEVYVAQRQWHEEWAAHLEEYLRRDKRADRTATAEDIAGIKVDRSWPIRALVAEGAH